MKKLNNVVLAKSEFQPPACSELIAVFLLAGITDQSVQNFCRCFGFSALRGLRTGILGTSFL